MPYSPETLTTKDTKYYADTVEWCPVEGFKDFLLCGTYQLIEKDFSDDLSNQDGGRLKPEVGRRVGNVQLYQLDNESRNVIKCCSRAEGGGILDIKWYHDCINGTAVAGAVSAESELKILTLSPGKDDVQGQLADHHTTVIGSNKICLSLDWSYNTLASPRCVISDSQGQLTVLECHEASWEGSPILQWTAHGYEAWIAAYDTWAPYLVYSGGDDCLFRGWDTRTDCTTPIFTSRKHDMGVSSIQCNPIYEHVMATGSYDEAIYVWDKRNRKSPLTTVSPGGGVWRIKWHPRTGIHILTATMYEGYYILKYTHDSSELVPVASYTDNAQLAYGADWCRHQLHRGQATQDVTAATARETHSGCEYDLIATCSFYDHIMHLWKICL